MVVVPNDGSKDNQLFIYLLFEGPGMGAPLASVAVVARTVAKLWNKPILGRFTYFMLLQE